MPKPPNFFNILWLFNSLKPSKTPPKIDAKTSQNRAQDAPKSRFGGGPLKIRFWAPNFPLLGGVLGRPGGVLGASWARLGAVLGALGRLGSVLGPSWDVLGTSGGAFHCTFNLKASCDRLVIDFYFQVRSPEPWKSLVFPKEKRGFFKNCSSKLWSILDAILMPT